MKKLFEPVLLLSLWCLPQAEVLANGIDPVSFEQIWFQNNQRNVFKRYHYYNEQVNAGSDNLYLLGFDAAPDKQIKTSAGVKDALMNSLSLRCCIN